MCTLCSTLEELREQVPKHTVIEIVLSFTLNFIANQLIELLKCILCHSHTGNLGSRLDNLDDIETEKNLSIS